ncbi:MAG TPA: DUF1844 domain-containing protein [Acidobacteriaceae bacterium]|jgi:hypothetical protein|nr:DUF1844 domain-containing protein [Acidobacteriaceae bacterium]
MEEKEPQFTVIDRRKFTSEGDIRPDAATEPSEESKAAHAAPAAAPDEHKTQAASGIHAVPQAPESSANTEPTEEEQAVLQPPTAEESAAAHNAYTETSRQMDDILRSKMPNGMQDTNVSFEHVIQSLYMTAVMHLGAGTPQGEKARIDLMGARQTIDMLDILAKKTVGNLMESEQHMLDSALFEARMMFLEVTNAIARSATQAAKQPGVPPFDPKGRR